MLAVSHIENWDSNMAAVWRNWFHEKHCYLLVATLTVKRKFDNRSNDESWLGAVK